MKMAIISVLFAIGFLHGCVSIKIGGVKATETNEISRRHIESKLESFVFIEPKLTADGELTLWVFGVFENQDEIDQSVVEYGNEWMAIGLFPGFYSMINGYVGTEKNPAEAILFDIGANIWAGIPTIASLVEFMDSKVAQQNSDISIAQMGFVGTYKYEGSTYEMNMKAETIDKTETESKSSLLKEYKVLVDGIEYIDNDGIVNIGRKVERGQILSFSLTTLPNVPKGCADKLANILNVEFFATCQ